VSRVLFLDSGPLGLLVHPQRSAEVVEISDWLYRCVLNGCRVVVPAIVHYELRRELLRAGKTSGLQRLEAFTRATPERYLPLADEALWFAAELWARRRQAGRPTAAPQALDIDVILAAQVLKFAGGAAEATLVTTNPKHFQQLIPAKLWKEVEP
jgi:predicted nucleic acid-binding protein